MRRRFVTVVGSGESEFVRAPPPVENVGVRFRLSPVDERRTFVGVGVRS
jgi:hypothetical protein